MARRKIKLRSNTVLLTEKPEKVSTGNLRKGNQTYKDILDRNVKRWDIVSCPMDEIEDAKIY